MSKQIIIGFTTEGGTDIQFLESVIQRSFEDVAFECKGQIEVLPVQYIKKQSGSFAEMVKTCARQAEHQGIMVLCIHADADDTTDTNTFNCKINPAFIAINDTQGKNMCKNLVPIVPVQMTEAWMLSDKDLLKAEIGTNKNDEELGIDKSPEIYNNPKQTIETAIRVARQNLPKRRRRELTISELYSPIGQKVALNTLENLPSYRRFKEAVRGAFKKLNYLY
ncbi:MAG: DUF4276 family protein [Desulfobacteraceae bacterium]|nr:DUF4276 family protein [Desulfobacteraceae bacterium]